MNKIRELRKQFNYTQTELALLCKTTTSNVSGWECGKWQPDNETLILLANTFNVTVDYLLGRENRSAGDLPEGAAETKKTSITPIEEAMLNIFREIGIKHGKEAQTALITVAEKML